MRRIVGKLNEMTLRSRLLVAIFLCILLPWVSTYIVSNYFTKDVLEVRAVKQSKDTLSMIEMSMKRILDDAMYTSNFIQFDTNFNRLLKSNQSFDSNSPESINIANRLHYLQVSKRLTDITDMFSYTYVTILFENGLYYTNYPISENNPLTFRDKPWFSELKDLQFYQTNWIGVHPTYIQSEKESDPYLISMARTIKGSNHSNIYLIISIEEKEVREFFNNFQNDTEAVFFLTDNKGKIYSSLDTEKIGSHLSYDITSKEHQIVEYNDEDHLLVSYPVSYANWRLVSLVPYKETIGTINTVTRTTILIQGALLLLFLFALIILIREITKPVTKLSFVTKSVEQGNLDVRANVSGNSDVAKLAHSFDHMLDRIEEMIEQVKEREEEKRMAELEMLQAQINPHFLFNVLNSIRLKIRLSGDKDSAQLIYSLSALLRMTINRNNAFIPLSEELTIVRHYLQLMNFRHQDDIQLEAFMSKKVEEIKIPRFFLQPIVENAFIHGYNHGNGTIIIMATLKDNNRLQLQVTDDGSGMDEMTLESLKREVFAPKNETKTKNTRSFNGIGVQNVFQRMQMIYGDDFKLEIESIEGVGTTFTFNIPIEKE
ncbi:cache domain-containing sensor histidine kinase [Sporosarcina beigongshangi]|uniref:cache domain-containing sensor histidine kinase n=1 Tax=Sporosarcina beigongshangi TaxID=2782538 RepID=UPI00193A2315|nr:histidine kinase [Sporosarcina beigongshangi]